MSESPPHSKILVTSASPRGWHRLQLAAECLQKYAYTYHVPKAHQDMSSAPALAKGSLVHLVLAQHYMQMKSAPGEYCDPVESITLFARVNKLEKFLPDVIKTYEKYTQRYWRDSEEYRVLEVEELHQIQVGVTKKYLLTGRLDLVLEDAGGRVWVLDHKTSSRVTPKHAEYYAISGQLMGYARMAKEKYRDRFAGFIVNLVEIGGGNFSRIVLERNTNLEPRFDRIVQDIEESIERMEAAGRDVDDWPKAINEMTCIGRYGACQYITKCRYGVDVTATGGNWSWEG